MSLHEDEVSVDEALVATLLRQQAPDLAALPVRRLATTGTVNHVFRLGDGLLVRLPRTSNAASDPGREAALLPLVASALPVAVPDVVVLGAPAPAFPMPWTVLRWIEGDAARPGRVPVDDLAAAVLALRALPVRDLPSAGRPAAAEAGGEVRAAVEALEGVDRDDVLEAWRAALAAPGWEGEPVPVHADLLPPNLLVRGGRLVAVLDWASAGAGDPANDLVPAWSCFRGADRDRYRGLLGADDAAWARARGVALAQAVVAIPYYDRTDPAFAALCRGTLAEVLAETVQAPT